MRIYFEVAANSRHDLATQLARELALHPIHRGMQRYSVEIHSLGSGTLAPGVAPDSGGTMGPGFDPDTD